MGNFWTSLKSEILEQDQFAQEVDPPQKKNNFLTIIATFIVFGIWALSTYSRLSTLISQNPSVTYSYPGIPLGESIILNSSNFAFTITDYEDSWNDYYPFASVSFTTTAGGYLSIPLNSSWFSRPKYTPYTINGSLTLEAGRYGGARFTFKTRDCTKNFEVCFWMISDYTFNETDGAFDSTETPINVCLPVPSNDYSFYNYQVTKQTVKVSTNRFNGKISETRTKYIPPEFFIFSYYQPATATCQAGTNILTIFLDLTPTSEEIVFKYDQTVLDFISETGGFWSSVVGYGTFIFAICWFLFRCCCMKKGKEGQVAPSNGGDQKQEEGNNGGNSIISPAIQPDIPRREGHVIELVPAWTSTRLSEERRTEDRIVQHNRMI